MTIIHEYLDLQEKYEKKYGEKTIVLMQVGGFFEIYGIVNDTVSKGRIYEVSEITNLNVSKKNDKYSDISDKNPLMAGFPLHSFEKWKDILLKENYTIIKIEQFDNGSKTPERKITEILSQGVNIDTTSFTNSILSVYIEDIKDYKTQKPILFVGISVADITTGETTVYETFSSSDDYKFALDEVYRFIQIFTPSEIVMHTEHLDMTKDDMISYLELSNVSIRFNIYSGAEYKHFLQNKFKLEILKKVYSASGMLTPIEFIDMEKLSFALNSFIYLIQFIYEHNESIIEKLNKPRIFEPNNYLSLSHDSIIQLNVIPDRSKQQVKGISCLWDIIDKTSTSMGKRYLRDNLLNPLINKNELIKRYDLVERVQQKKGGEYIYKGIKDYLKNISDIERLHRRMGIKMLNPCSFLSLDNSYEATLKVIQYLKDTNDSSLINCLPSNETIEKFKLFIDDYRNKLLMNKIAGTTLSNLEESIFKEGIYDEIDSTMEKINDYKSYFNSLCKGLSDMIDEGKDFFELKYNERDGHYLSTTNTRANSLKKAFQTKNNKLQYTDSNGKVQNIEFKDLELKQTTGVTKITSKDINNYSHGLISYQSKLTTQCSNAFNTLLQTYYVNYNTILMELVKFISYIDFISCIGNVSKDNGYCKPEIIDNEQSYLDAKELRHPIIEKIQTNIQYVSNDIVLGKDDNEGVLLFGLNCVGKSTMMKSVGLAIIMAQCGFYVPATKFTFSPYKYLFTRISSNDNIFKGQSTFAVEMSELRAILKRANKNSLVLGDELCSGTETTSALAIVTAGVIRLCQKNASFIFTTHLHKLAEMEEIIKCKNVHSFHMETLYDEVNKKLIYNRKLQPGNGSAIYGLEVAKAMDLDEDFINMANQVRKRIMGIGEKVVNNKVSQFNSSVIINKCSICNYPTEEVHHIHEQHLANDMGMIDNFHKNNLWNLVQLCHTCHNSVHNGDLKINGYLQTSNGVELAYTKCEKKKEEIKSNNKKYKQEQINLIKEIYNNNKSITNTKKELDLKHTIKISNDTIKKIVNNTY